ncbi:MAG: hypothetical protein QXN35_03265 [Ignisphaera sp.]
MAIAFTRTLVLIFARLKAILALPLPIHRAGGQLYLQIITFVNHRPSQKYYKIQ